ncbi:prepilin peptidase [Chondromyces apiculatus]|uniref:Prepilin type IV endopeptidase peptidase domain-containing protein n=1 Tax=Chondromyces apiculatus DSM 436 TaxID=1192034 RepID=A0A017TCR1_9BACT|nr:A24 family peptidase [Chondromyces apiculatus]EYF06585.1 Hypothetical protein CAP_1715 [Chondromyces apiculatus DSM 436]
MLGQHHFLASAIVVTAIAAFHDWRTGEIPNWVTLGPLCVAPLAHFGARVLGGGSFQAGAEALGASILGAIVCAMVPILLYRMSDGRAFGGGDVKLLAAVGAIMRPMVGIEAEYYAIFAGLLIGLGKLAYEGKLMRTLKNTVALAVNPILPRHLRREVSPEMMTMTRFGPAIFLGTCCAALTNWRDS